MLAKCIMAQYQLRVVDDELHVQFLGGKEFSTPLDASHASNTTKNMILGLVTDEGVGMGFKAGVLEVCLPIAGW